MRKLTIASLGLLMVIALLGLSWAVTVGLVKLITLCFGLEFSLKIATGIWIVILILRSIFKTTVHKG